MARFRLPADYLGTFADRIQAISPEQIQEAMAVVVDPVERTILVVGDRQGIEPKLHKLPFKEFRIVDSDGRPVGH